jgi:hypothetical protein
MLRMLSRSSTCQAGPVLQPQGYYTIDDLLDAFSVGLPFLEQQIEAQHLCSSLTMFNEPWYRQDIVHRWMLVHENEISAEQARIRAIKLETVR